MWRGIKKIYLLISSYLLPPARYLAPEFWSLFLQSSPEIGLFLIQVQAEAPENSDRAETQEDFLAEILFALYHCFRQEKDGLKK